MGNFKIGDWVKSKYKTVKVKSFIILDKIDYIQDSESGLMPIWQAELWRPKEGEWVIQKINENSFQVFKFNPYFNHTDDVEPFIGELPSFIKDKQ